jgi:hypothetical protein
MRALGIIMNIEASINDMYSEILEYSGNFGDPIVDNVTFNPIAVLKEYPSREIEIGAGIGLLVEFTSSIDNSTYENALKGKNGKNIKLALHHEFCKDIPEIYSAFKLAGDSEEAFLHSLADVYFKHVLRVNA